jgi:ubiquinone biosynthesis protein UbiJ
MSQQRAPNPLLATLARALEALIERAMTLEPALRERLRPFEGRRVDLVWTSAGIGIGLAVIAGRVEVGPPAGAPDLAVRGTLAGAAKLAFEQFGGPRLDLPGKVEIAGDVGLARELSKLTDKLDPDLESAFARALGPVFGPQLARLLQAGFARLRRNVGDLARDAAYYVQDESRTTVSGPELASFHADVDALRDRVERLAQRVARLLPHTERDA